MTIVSGTVNTGITNDNVDAAITDIGAAIAAHPSWDFVERVTTTTTGRYADVYYNATIGAYVALAVSANAGTQVGIFFFEGYVSPNVTKGVIQLSGGAPDSANAADDSWVGSKHIADGNKVVAPTNAGNLWGVAPTLVGTAVPWYMSITPERIVLLINGYGPYYIGLAEKPVGSRWRWEGVLGIVSNAAANAVVNRAVYGLTTLSATLSNPRGYIIPTVSRDVNLDKFVYSKIPVITAQGYCGTLRDIISFTPPAGVGLLDDVTLDGVNYSYFSANLWVRTDA